MEERDRGLILRLRPLTESSVILNWLTVEHGRISTVAKGARKPKSTFAGKLDIYHELELSWQPSRKSELHALREVSFKWSNPDLRADFHLLEQAAYAASLIEKLTETENPAPELYDLFKEFLESAQATTGYPLLFSFELKLLDHLGFGPNFEARQGSALGQGIAREVFLAELKELRPITGRQEWKELDWFCKCALMQALDRLPVKRERAHAIVEPGG